MTRHVSKFVTPISRSLEFGKGSAWGTGSYCELFGTPFLLTNEHVATVGPGWTLGHLPGPTDEYIQLDSPFHASGAPIDVAIIRVAGLGDNRATVASRHMSRRYGPVSGELLFWLGYPGSRCTRNESITELRIRSNWFKGPLETPCVPFISQAVPAAPTKPLAGFHVDLHVLVHYPAKAARIAGDESVDLPNPHGMSGSLLWDTRFVASTLRGDTWSPACARVCGLIWAAHDKPEVVVATRIEHVRHEFVASLRGRSQERV